MVDGLEPHDHIPQCVSSTRSRSMEHGAGRVYPGYGDEGGRWEGYTGYYPPTVPGSHIEHNLAIRPYPRPYEGNLRLFNEVSQDGSRIGSRYASELTQNDPPR